ncbi:MAG: hypothetical protein U0M72_03865 [Eggerthellaceae bacterium]
MPEHNNENGHNSHSGHGGHGSHGRCSFAALKRDLLEECPLDEKEHRTLILDAIERKLARQGQRTARAHRNRARQFMPFAALKGYADMVQQQAEKETLSPKPHFPRSPIELPKEPGSQKTGSQNKRSSDQDTDQSKGPVPSSH